ncbi:lysozyme inhibitor LprI family protein [Paraburkholderia tropica]|uniref:lysozyme inhibitor LprI family protein n=1 Tax=Paraburkholderia tropica TaxID=92647 RepID=UPI0007ED236F|nr:hypothetical protein [Paraburkholderia tropica]OBR54754.1 hypothetical protein A6456_34950 [Paraburkholderia tropica]
MAALGSGLLVAGALTALAGVSGFIDTRKVDRRFKTGYKNNEPDNRNFGRAGKILLYGIGMCIVGGAINSFLDRGSDSTVPTIDQSQTASTTPPVQSVASESEATGTGMVKLDPNDAQPPQQTQDPTSSNERVLNSDAAPAAAGTQEGAMQASGSTQVGATSATPLQTFPTSFDCRRATHDDEAAICGDAGLAAMDRQLSQLYGSAMKTISDPQALKQSEADWVLTRRMCNQDVDCLRHLYGERIGQFLGSLGSKPLLPVDKQANSQ